MTVALGLAFHFGLLTLPADQSGSPKAAGPTKCEETPQPAKGARLPFGKLKTTRGEQLIVDEGLLERVVPDPEAISVGGITTPQDLSRELLECSDDPGVGPARGGDTYNDASSGLTVRVIQGDRAGKSGRNWEGYRCRYRLEDPSTPDLYAELGPDEVPAFNTLSGILRRGQIAFVSLQFNGYAKEVHNQGNLIVAVDLCRHRTLWRSPSLVSNAGMLLHGPYLLTGYGFTAEAHALFALDAATGTVAQKLTIPKSPEELRVKGGKLYARIYDGYVEVQIQP